MRPVKTRSSRSGPAAAHLLKSWYRAGRVIGIELDRDMIGELETKFARSENFKVISSDALSVDYAAIERDAGGKLKLVANLPYYISTAILQRLIEQRNSFSEMVLMFQREVVDRIAAEPGHTDPWLSHSTCRGVSRNAKACSMFRRPHSDPSPRFGALS